MAKIIWTFCEYAIIFGFPLEFILLFPGNIFGK